jgi:hypothetical protein
MSLFILPKFPFLGRERLDLVRSLFLTYEFLPPPCRPPFFFWFRSPTIPKGKPKLELVGHAQTKSSVFSPRVLFLTHLPTYSMHIKILTHIHPIPPTHLFSPISIPPPPLSPYPYTPPAPASTPQLPPIPPIIIKPLPYPWPGPFPGFAHSKQTLLSPRTAQRSQTRLEQLVQE